MKQDTIFMVIKGIGLVGAATFLAYNNGLSQWANSGEWPSRIELHLIYSNTAAAFFTALVTFCSGSVSRWSEKRNVNGVDNSIRQTDIIKP